MSQKWLAWSVIAFAVLFLYGCPKQQPQTAPEPPEVTMEEAEPAEEVPEAPEPAVEDEVEVDPLESEDLREVNEAAEQQGYNPSVYFDFDKSDLKPAAREKLSENATFLRQHAEFIITIEGHCDERGTNEYNLALGERRANSAKDYLTSLGVAADRIRTISYGEERPVCTESDESCWQRNRRAYMPITARR